MEKFVIQGGAKLSGTIKVNGAKNSALKILAALVLSDEECTISNFPFIEDALSTIEILKDLRELILDFNNLVTLPEGICRLFY